MSRKHTETKANSLKTFVIFCSVVLILIIISLSIKAFILIKESKFAGNRRFTIAIKNQNNTTTHILSFDPKNKTILKLSMRGKPKTDQIGKILGVYIDGAVQIKPELKDDDRIGKQLISMATRFSTIKTNITILDLFRLSLLSNTVSGNKITKKEIKLPSGEAQVDKVIGSLFSDPDIVDEQESIEIINAVGSEGFGRRLERLLSTMGAQVVSVTTARNVEPTSKIYYSGEKSYTLGRVENIIGKSAIHESRKGIANIQIVLGKDKGNSDIF